MSAAPIWDQPYQAGGALPANASSYVIRQADTELCEGLRAMKFCYVFNSRQMGKSSLRVRAMKTLTKEGFACFAIEMRDICSHQVTEDAFYATIVSHLASGLELEIDEGDWWHKHDYLSPFERLSKFFQDELIENLSPNIVIFIDEIDSIINLKFKDDFFGFIRACYNKRADNPQYDRITFALLGVATPSDLIEDNIRTPFNIDCRAIELTGFHLHEANPLQQGLQEKSNNPERVLKVVLDWTGGQPFLTQKLCKLISDSAYIEEGDEEKAIGELVRSHIIKNWLTQDNPEHLRTIRDRILRSKQGTKELLKLYHKIRQGKEVTADDTRKQIELRLSGLIVNRNGNLKAYNPIYESVFDLDWVNNKLKALQPDSPALPAWTVVAASVLVTVLVMGVRSLGVLERFELPAYDYLMRSRPAERIDKHILVVAVTQEDTDKYGYPLKDAKVAELIKKLVQYKPKVIGLDMHRSQRQGEGREDLIAQFQHKKNLFTVCAFSSSNKNYAPPSEFSKEQLRDKMGFSELLVDNLSDNSNHSFRRDLVVQPTRNPVRRQLLAYDPKLSLLSSPCITPYSFSFQLAFRFLYEKNIKPLTVTKNNEWQFGKVVFGRLAARTGGYQLLDGLSSQILINYRSNQPAQVIPLKEILLGQIKPELVKDRIVLIGTTASNAKDDFETPYGRMPGVWIHAHMVSQILSAVMDERSLLWVLPQWGDFQWGDVLFVWGWSLIGGLIAWRFRSFLHLILLGGTATLVLHTTCLVILTHGGWMPLVPSALSLFGTGGALVIYTAATTRKQ
jgi:CHASE2 domain-containing sensor protein